MTCILSVAKDLLFACNARRAASAPTLVQKRRRAGRPPINLKSVPQSKIKTADAITVVHNPRLSPTADCVTFAVRTILFEIR